MFLKNNNKHMKLSEVSLDFLIIALTTSILFKDLKLNIPFITFDVNKYYLHQKNKDLEPGEIKYKVYLQQTTVDEIRKSFSNYLNQIKKQKPDEQDLIDFSVKYTDEKLRFRYTVIFPKIIRRSVQRIPKIGYKIMPPKINNYFQNLTVIDIAGKKERLTDCWDYAELFKKTYNIIAKDNNLNSRCYRVRADAEQKLFFGMFKRYIKDAHDFNEVKNLETGKIIYVDSNAQDTWFLKSKTDITDKVEVINN